MQTLRKGYKGAQTLMVLNWDRVLTTGMMILAMYLGGYLALM